MNQLEAMAALMRELFASYPPLLSIPMVAEILRLEVAAVRARIRRNAFPISVRQELGGSQYVLLADLVRFAITGEKQQAIERPIRLARNPLGLNGNRRRGAPTKAERVARDLAGKTR